MENKILKFKNYFLYNLMNPVNQKEVSVRSFQVYLMNLKLHGVASRSRTRFIRLISDRIKELDEERIKIAKEYSKDSKGEVSYLDEKGKKTTIEKTPNAIFDIKDMAKFMKEWEDYLNEDYIIDVTPANNDIINGVKAIVLNSEEDFAGREAVRYDEICQAFEDIYAKKDKAPKIDDEAPQVVKDLIEEKK